MFFRSTTLIAATAAILFAHTSLSAAVYRARHVQVLDGEQELEARAEYTYPANSTEYTHPDNSTHALEARKGAGGAADLLGDVVTSIITGIQDGINADKDARGKFTSDLVGQLHAKQPQFNWVVCHTKHDYKWDGQRGVDWDHRHQEFDVKIGGTIGYEIYNAKSGQFFRKGDGGYLNWAYIGNVLKTENDGKDLTFGKP